MTTIYSKVSRYPHPKVETVKLFVCSVKVDRLFNLDLGPPPV